MEKEYTIHSLPQVQVYPNLILQIKINWQKIFRKIKEEG